MAYIIAEIGNNHEGDVQKAYSMVLEARRCGVNAVKFQAGLAKDFARSKDDIPKYEKYVLPLSDFIGLAEYAKSLSLDVIFSIWSEEYNSLALIETYHKIPARLCDEKHIKYYDSYKTLVSIPYTNSEKEYKSKLLGLKRIMFNSIPLYCVSEYPTLMPRLENINIIREVFKDSRPIGYSDHTIGVDACIAAVKIYKTKYIEKHFTLDKNTKGIRDHKLSADSNDMIKLVSEVGSK